MSAGRRHVALAADGTELVFETHGNPADPAVLLGPHFYVSRDPDDESFTDAWIDGLAGEFFVIVADYPRGIGATRNPQGRSYTPDVAAAEYERIADAAGAARFAWIGYSFGGAMGVQVACRTSRVSALAVGGFPPLNAPFRQMTTISTALAEHPSSQPARIDGGVLWSAVGFYSSLVHWPEREAISRLSMPRLVFMGSNDSAQGAPEPIPLAESLRAVESELCGMGWKIDWLEGHGHATVLRPEVSLGLVRNFLRRALRSR